MIMTQRQIIPERIARLPLQLCGCRRPAISSTRPGAVITRVACVVAQGTRCPAWPEGIGEDGRVVVALLPAVVGCVVDRSAGSAEMTGAIRVIAVQELVVGVLAV